MLQQARIKAFILCSVLIHVIFVLLFARISLSFSPPIVKPLSLRILTRGGDQSEIVQSRAVWPMPRRIKPEVSPERIFTKLESETGEWTRFGAPDPESLVPRQTLVPPLDVAKLAAEAYVEPPENLFSPLPAESKSMPIPEFALGPVLPDILESD